MDVACDNAGNVFVIDHSPNKILKFDSGGHPASDWSVAGSLFQSPASIKLDKSNGQILIVDIQRRILVKLDRNGHHLVSFDVPGLSEAQHQLYFDLDDAGNLFIPDLSNSRVLILDRGGIPVMILGEESRGYGGVLGPVSVALMQRRLYVTISFLSGLPYSTSAGYPCTSERPLKKPGRAALRVPKEAARTMSVRTRCD